MSDYSSMSDAELSRAVAERLGYSVKKVRSGYYQKFLNGEQIGKSFYVGEFQAWQDFVYATDLNAAMQLGMDDIHLVRQATDGWFVEIADWGIPGSWAAYDKSPARVICIAWLQAQDAAPG